MKRALSTLIFAGLLTASGAALAGDNDAEYVRADGFTFTSDVGAACNALGTDVYFLPRETALEVHDKAPLNFLAGCFTSGNLHGAQVAIVAHNDGTQFGRFVASARARAVRDYLINRGVPFDQLSITWRADDPGMADNDGRIGFELNQTAWHDSWYRIRSAAR
ncbi:MAG: hypothetical protein H6745_33020 [Deltaproteobacteria bacterium]|nr:hypothetical protein [Deltaproteobacteria bacterium]